MIAAIGLTLALVGASLLGDADDVRALLLEALAAPDARARAQVAARAPELARKLGPEGFVEALRAGPLLGEDALEPRAGEELAEHGSVLVGFTFETGGARYRYALDLPRGYDRERPCGLLLDPGHGSARDGTDETRAEMLGMYRRHADRAGLDGWIVARTEIVEQIGAGGARGAEPDDEVARVFDVLFRDLATRVALDPDRIVVAGVSQTGFWSWYLGRARADRYAGINPMSAISRVPADAWLGNFLNLPVYALHGDQDAICPVEEPRATCARLALIGAPVRYREVEGAGHDYAVWGAQPDALKWLAERPRERYPLRVGKSLQTTRTPWGHWIRVDALEREGDGTSVHAPTGGVDGELDGQTVRLFSEGVEGLTLCLSREMLDLEAPVEVVWNGERVHSGPLERDAARTLEVAAEKADWTASFEVFLELER